MPILERADFHIHTDNSKDSKADPFKVVDAAIARELRVISITDHNSIGAYKKLDSYASDNGITLVEGTELSAFKWHLLLLGVPTKEMGRWYTKHDIEDGSVTTYKAPKLHDILDFVGQWGGVVIVPHPGLGIMSLSLSKLQEVAVEGLVHGVEIHNGELQRKMGALYASWHDHVTLATSHMNIAQVANSDAHKIDRIAFFHNLIKLESGVPITQEVIIGNIREGTIYGAQP